MLSNWPYIWPTLTKMLTIMVGYTKVVQSWANNDCS